MGMTVGLMDGVLLVPEMVIMNSCAAFYHPQHPSHLPSVNTSHESLQEVSQLRLTSTGNFVVHYSGLWPAIFSLLFLEKASRKWVKKGERNQSSLASYFLKRDFLIIIIMKHISFSKVWAEAERTTLTENKEEHQSTAACSAHQAQGFMVGCFLYLPQEFSDPPPELLIQISIFQFSQT